jgi:multiple antibiotic resistance protein
MNEIINSFLLVYAGLFPIVNPVGGAPIFLSMTRYRRREEREALAARIALNGFFLLLGSLLLGSHILEFFGITLPVLRIAGGLVVTAFAWRLLHSGEEPDHTRSELDNRPLGPGEAFYPLTMPLTVGPGSISVAIALGSQRPTGPADPTRLFLIGGAAVLGIAAIGLTIYVCFRYSERVVAFLGETGMQVVMRLAAFILLCIGIQIVWNGWVALNAAA